MTFITSTITIEVINSMSAQDKAGADSTDILTAKYCEPSVFTIDYDTKFHTRSCDAEPQLRPAPDVSQCAWVEDQVKHEETTEHIKPEVSWSEFTKNTTFHGVRYVFEDTKIKARRWLWMICVFGAILVFMIDVYQRTWQFFEYETNTSVQKTYPDRVLFPAVTICNHNTFRSTVVWSAGLYGYIDEVFGTVHIPDIDPSKYNLTGWDTGTFMMRTAHEQDTFIDSCRWAGKSCDPDHFVRTITDMGVCYTFKGNREVNESGADNGLSLILNIEQYEYMRGPQSDAGAKILLHDPGEAPLMKNLGFSVAPGTHSLVGITRTQIETMSSPYGKCVQGAPPISNCLHDCRTQQIASLCNSQDTPKENTTDNGETACDMGNCFICVYRNYTTGTKDSHKKCKCDVPCVRITYEPSLSYAHLSKFNIDRLVLSDTRKRQTVEETFKSATELLQRVDQGISMHDKTLLSDVLEILDRITYVIDSAYVPLQSDFDLTRLYNSPAILGEYLIEQGLRFDVDALKDRTKDLLVTYVGFIYDFEYYYYDDEEEEEEQSGYYDDYYGDYYIEDIIQEDFDFSISSSGSHKYIQNVNDHFLEMQNGISEFLNKLDSCESELTLPFNKNINPLEYFVTGSFATSGEYSTTTTTLSNPDTLDLFSNGDRTQDELCNGLENTPYNIEFPVNPTLEMFKVAYNCAYKIIDCDTYISTKILHSAYLAQQFELIRLERDEMNNFMDGYIPFIKYAFVNSTRDPMGVEEHRRCVETVDILNTTIYEYGQLTSHLFTNLYAANTTEMIRDIAHQIKHLTNQAVVDYSERLGPAQQCAWIDLLQCEEGNCAAASQYIRLIENAIDNFPALQDTFQVLGNTINQLHNILVLKLHPSMRDIIHKYIQQNITKSELVDAVNGALTEQFIKETITKGYDVVDIAKNFVSEMKGQCKLIKNAYRWAMLDDIPLMNWDFWENDFRTNLLDMVRLHNNSEYDDIFAMMYIDEEQMVTELFDRLFQPYREILQRFTIGDELNWDLMEFDKTTALLSDELSEYKADTKVDNDFYLGNFLQVDIFYKEISEEIIVQHKAFPFLSLLSEVGGFLGLLLGASILTVVELVDYLLLMAIRKWKAKTRILPSPAKPKLTKT